MKIAVLAWGSLLWELNELKIASDWSSQGPVLPLEFSRVSDNKKLTLVIDPKNGEEVVTFYATSAFEELTAAIENLRERESASLHNIGMLQRGSGGKEVPPSIVEWLEQSDYQAVIWTASPPNFEEAMGMPFSIKTAIGYLNSLDADMRASAIEYFDKTPSQISTPLRTRLANMRVAAA